METTIKDNDDTTLMFSRSHLRITWLVIFVAIFGLGILHFLPPATPRVKVIPCSEGTFPGRIPPPHEYISPAPDDGCVYIDRTGTVVMRPPVAGCPPFVDGYVATYWKDSQTNWGYLARDGTRIHVDSVDNILPASDGMARFRVPANLFPNISWKYGFVDLVKATTSIPPRYDHAGDFSEGLARVNKGASNWNRGYITGGRWGYVDRAGKVVIPITLHGAGDFSEGLAPAAEYFQRWGYIDRSGAWVIQPQFESAKPFSDGLARVRKNGKVVFIDRDGNVAVTPMYEPMYDFAEGFAVVSSNEDGYNQGFINQSGDLAFPLRFSEVKSFSEGLSAVSIGPAGGENRRGYIDKNGILVIKPHFLFAESFHGGLARVSIFIDEFNRKNIYIDSTGKQVWPKTEEDTHD